jgi:hypothetical protein
VIHHVQVCCPPDTKDVLRAFYVDVVGFTELVQPPMVAPRGGCWFGGDDIELHVGVEADFRPNRKAHPGLMVADLDGLADRLATAGYAVDWAPADEVPGLRRFHTNDPHGNRLEFLTPA